MSIIWNFKNTKKIGNVKYPYPIEEEKVVIGSIGSDEVKSEYLIPTMRLQRDEYKYPIKYKPIKSLQGFIDSISQFYDSYPDLKGKISNQEVFGAIYIDRSNRPLGITYFGIGSVSAVVADPKLIMSAAVLLNASGVFIFHNHPANSMAFSPQDQELSKKIAQSCFAMDISYTDFVVVSPNVIRQYPVSGLNYYSAREDEPNLLKP
jgi:DNA repair protein RadC